MIKLNALFDHEVNGKKCHFFMDNDTPIAEAKQMCLDFFNYLSKVEEAYKENIEKERNSLESSVEKCVNKDEVIDVQ